ncbi:alpha/beta fold hydrolase [Rhodococcus sp. IEGM 1401]|uniref:alpha/beta fold hydrolase n=1 Tax=unclassified Rhodococcus (in: high G+C Gram-positive bacteria) TaxID=192944 RepID=UPI0022B40DF8|nr:MULTISPECIES: alpha/beta fold hydrolase [unclassified Rhodococcus (in: high G+C Gram-positive bacteria)]MCZ4562846.1 alpha/beta fold hydrolase [Rhodococcus sp. IEGM 1401]MDI6626572.1 alpha/beta fold hydrolase [Rhodococcus sp. (in: high G+C Gram-positive bacteria)]MDI9922969.1 alpha/beta fold hydrolase [Rhodococcus sp. IEGM 1372]MDV8035559.1 alpha/beta fold hydrolase [Rhodococcus sp. IEGM 1414]
MSHREVSASNATLSSAARSDTAVQVRELASHRIRYVDRGHGPVLVLVHGLMGSLHDWDPHIEGLSNDFRVIAVDLPGHGESDKVPGDYSLSAHAATIRDLLDSLGIESVTMVGHSYGGGVAMQMLYLFPQMVDGICLIASGGFGQEVNPVLRAAAVPGSGLAIPVAASMVSRAVVGGALGVLKRLRLFRLGPGDRRAWGNFASMADPATRRAFLSTARSVIDFRGQTVSATRLLANFTDVRALLIWGERDAIIPISHAHAVREHMPDGTTLEVVPGAGHFPHLDEPRRFDSVIRDFMSTFTAPSTSRRSFTA